MKYHFLAKNIWRENEIILKTKIKNNRVNKNIYQFNKKIDELFSVKL